MNTLDRYLGRIILQYTLVATLILLCLYTFINFIDQLENIGQGSFHLQTAAFYLLMLVPSTLYELFPMSTLLGSIMGLSMLARNSELTAIRTSGWSMLQITVSVLKVGGLFVILCLMIGEFAAPHTRSIAEHTRAEAMKIDVEAQDGKSVWLRDGNTYTTIQEILPDLALINIRSFAFSDDGSLQSIIEAERGRFADGSWVLEDSRISTFERNADQTVVHVGQKKWNTTITPDILAAFLVKPDQLSFVQLGHYIAYLENNQQNSDRFVLAWWNKIMLPLAIAAMVALAVPFAFTNQRSGNLGRNLFVGIMIGIAFYVANRGFSYAVLAGGIAPSLGASIPVLALLCLIILLMRRI